MLMPPNMKKWHSSPRLGWKKTTDPIPTSYDWLALVISLFYDHITFAYKSLDLSRDGERYEVVEGQYLPPP